MKKLLCRSVSIFFASTSILLSTGSHKDDFSKTWHNTPAMLRDFSEVEDLPLLINSSPANHGNSAPNFDENELFKNGNKTLPVDGGPHRVITPVDSNDEGEDITVLSNISRGSNDDDDVLNTKRSQNLQVNSVFDRSLQVQQECVNIDQEKYPFQNERKLPLPLSDSAQLLMSQSDDNSLPSEIQHTRVGSPASEVGLKKDQGVKSEMTETGNNSSAAQIQGTQAGSSTSTEEDSKKDQNPQSNGEGAEENDSSSLCEMLFNFVKGLC